MDINLKDTLKSLRQKKNITQETLANYLGISQQSVGKWERGEGFPDITLLPKLALYFNVSIDELLNVGQVRIAEKINEYEQEGIRLGKIGDISARIALWEQAYAEFPNDHRVMRRLMNAILCKGVWPIPEEDTARIIELGTRIMEESTDASLRENAISDLCTAYQNIGDTEKALYYADMSGSVYNCKEMLRADVLNGEEGIKESQYAILHLVFCAAMETVNITVKEGISTDEEIMYIKFSIDLLKLLFSDGNVGGYAFDLSWRYSILARTYASQSNEEKTFEALDECVKYCIMDAEKTEGFYTAPVINRIDYGKNFSKNFKGNACNVRLKELEWNNFDFIRETPRFKEIVDLLKKYAED